MAATAATTAKARARGAEDQSVEWLGHGQWEQRGWQSIRHPRQGEVQPAYISRVRALRQANSQVEWDPATWPAHWSTVRSLDTAFESLISDRSGSCSALRMVALLSTNRSAPKSYTVQPMLFLCCFFSFLLFVSVSLSLCVALLQQVTTMEPMLQLERRLGVGICAVGPSNHTGFWIFWLRRLPGRSAISRKSRIVCGCC